jgi:hypothetical protein
MEPLPIIYLLARPWNMPVPVVPAPVPLPPLLLLLTLNMLLAGDGVRVFSLVRVKKEELSYIPPIALFAAPVI